MRVALYPRVSGIEQAQEGYSIGEQIERMTKYCEAKGWTIYKIYTDAGFSGANMDRPGLQGIMKDCEKDVFDMVLVYKLDRLSRKQKDVLYLVEDVFDKHGIFFSSMTENFDTSTPFGKAILGILAVFAQLEREQIRERTMMGKKARADEGKWHGGSTEPIGYDYNVADDMLYINEYEAMQIREIVDLFLKGTPIRTIERICDEKGYKHKHGKWSPRTIRRMLTSPLYIGMLQSKNGTVKGIHKPILEKETFDEVQVLMDERKNKYPAPSKAKSTLLGGLLYCKNCGGRYGKNVNDHGGLYYACYSRTKKMKSMIKDPNCKNKIYRMLDLDYMVIEAITHLSLDEDYIEEVKHSKPVNDVESKRKITKKEIEGIVSQMSNLMNLYSLNKMPIELIDKQIADLNDRKVALEKELESLDVPDTDDEGMTNEEIQTLASVINNKDLTIEDKRKVVASLIYYIEIDEENVSIHWKF